MTFLAILTLQTLRMAARIWMSIENWINRLVDKWDIYWNQHILRHYFVRTDGMEFEQNMTRVPKDTLYFNEVAPNKVQVLYEDDEIVPYEGDASAPVRTPWLWVGHGPTTTDLSHGLQKYLLPGNFIMLDLLEHLMGRDIDDGFMYMDTSLQLRTFPVEGIRIETQYDSVPTR